MGLFDKIKDFAKKTIQTIIPGGSKGFFEPKPTPTTPSDLPATDTKGLDVGRTATRTTGTFQGPTRPTTDVETFRQTGVSTQTTAAQQMVNAINRAANTEGDRATGFGEITPGTTGGPGRQGIERERGILEKIFKTASGQFRTDMAGQFTAITGKEVAAEPIGIGFVGGSGGTQLVKLAPNAVKGVGVLQQIKNLATVKNVFLGLTTIAGIDVLTTWFAADNIASTSSYYSNLVWDRFNNGEITRAEAITRLNELESNFKASSSFINYSTMLNPTLWPFRKFFMTGTEAFEVNIAENRRLIETTQETKSAMFDRTREEEIEQFELNQQSILDAQLAAEDRFKQAQRDRDSNAQAWAKEEAQFYEAIRKRNAGEPLTQAEIDLLLSWGVNPNITFADYDSLGPSNLNFGLL